MMGKLEPFNSKRTTWEGLWFHPESNVFTSANLSLADIKKFKGTVRLVVKKNRYFEKGKNGRPNYVFMLVDSNSERYTPWPVLGDIEYEAEDENFIKIYEKNDEYIDEKGNRFFTWDEVMTVIHGVIGDVKCGYTDLLPEDYV